MLPKELINIEIDFALRVAELKPIYNDKPCFIYDIQGDTVFLHFNNNEGAEPGPLSKQSMPARLHELKNIFSDLHANHPEIKTVSGYSWLYNLESYKRLFPQPFTQNPTKITDDFGYNIFGQFLNSAHQIKQDAKKNFLKNVKNAKTYNEVIQAFEFHPLKVQAPMEVFGRFY